MELIEVEINNWSKYNPRSTIKSPRWFALSNRILEDPHIWELTDAEFRAWIYILCQASAINSSVVRLSVKHAHRVGAISLGSLESCIHKLEKAKCIQRRDHGKNTSVHAVITTGQDKTEHIVPKGTHPTELGLHRLIEIWNQECGTLPQVRKSNAARNRKVGPIWIQQHPTAWVHTIKKIAVSDFCNGKNDRGWQATFDWLIQPDTYLKVNEGKYDNRVKAPKADAWIATAELVRSTLRSHGPDDQEAIKQKLGPGLYSLLTKVGSARIRGLPDNDFYIKTVIGLLKSAEGS